MKELIVDEKAIRKKMIDCDIKSINELSTRTGVSKPTIYEYFNGKSPISSPLIKLCDELGVSPKDILIENSNEEVEEDV